MSSRLPRHSTARGSKTGLVPVGPTKVKAHKSVLLTEGPLAVEIIQEKYHTIDLLSIQ